jgi:hypothetical protein
MDPESLSLLEDGLRKTMLSVSGPELDAALAELGWAEMLSDLSELAIPLVFRLLGETGSHASVLNDVVLLTAGREAGATPALPYAGNGWVVWDYAQAGDSTALGGLPLRRVDEGGHLRLPDARRAVGWWLVGSAATCAGPGAVRPSDRIVSGGPAPTGRDAGGDRRRRGDAHAARRRQSRSDLTAGQGSRGQGCAHCGQALPAGARRHRLHRRARSPPPRQTCARARRIARQLKRTHPAGRRGPAGPRLRAATRRALTLPISASARVCTSTRRKRRHSARARQSRARARRPTVR